MSPIESPRPAPHGSLTVCMITDCFPPSIGGIENHVYALACELAGLGHRVTVVTHDELRPYGQSVRTPMPSLPAGLTLQRLPGLTLRLRGADPAVDPRMLGHLARLVARVPFDLAHGHTIEAPFPLGLLLKARALGLPTVFTKHSMILRPTRAGFLGRLGVKWMARLAARFDAGIAVSDDAAGELANAGVPVHTISNGIDPVRFAPDAAVRCSQRAALGLTDGSFVLGFMSRFVESKGVRDLPEIARRVFERVPDGRMLLVGDGPLRAAVERRADELGLLSRFVFVGFQPWHATPAYLNAMDAFVFPSISEGFGLALAEAMACGLPCIVRDGSGSRGLVRDGETAFVADSTDAMASRAIRLAEEPALRAKMGATARRTVVADYSWRAAAERTVEVYREAIARHASRRG